MDDTASQEKAKLQADAEKELVRLWRVWRTIHEMCYDRGYELTEEERTISLDEFRSRFSDAFGAPDRKKMTTSFKPTTAMIEKYTPLPTLAKPNPEAQIGTIWIEFSTEPSIGVKQTRAFGHHLHQHHFHTGILVTQQAISPSAMKVVPVVLPKLLEIFQEQELLVNITQHELVPKHVLLSPEEKKRLLERYRLKETQLPRIQTGDPVARYLGLRRGNVVKIIRKSETAGRYASYRWAI